MALSVVKFGGSSLKDNESINRVAGIIGHLVGNGDSVVAVVSAQGDTTDILHKKALALSKASPLREIDALLSAGEIVSSALLAIALCSMGISAVSLNAWQAGIITNNTYGNATVREIRTDRILGVMQSHKVAVIAGFQGVDYRGNITTLGRGGSDTTAVVLAQALGCTSCKIYTDVDGVYSADPRRITAAQKIQSIDYRRMCLLAENGAAVLHDRCVAAAMHSNIEIEVLSSLVPSSGTVISRSAVLPEGPIAIAFYAKDQDIGRLSVVGRELLNGIRVVNAVDRVISESNTDANIIRSNDLISFDVLIPEAYRLEGILHKLLFE